MEVRDRAGKVASRGGSLASSLPPPTASYILRYITAHSSDRILPCSSYIATDPAFSLLRVSSLGPNLSMPASTSTEDIILDLSQAPFAIITFNMPSKKNAMNGQQYKRLSQLLQVRGRAGLADASWELPY